MKKAFTALLMLGLCAAAFGGGRGEAKKPRSFAVEDAEISALGAVGRMETALAGPAYAGDGGRELRLAVMLPAVKGDVPAYLPFYVQGLLHNNFGKYSAITLVDRQNLEPILAEQRIANSGDFSDEDYVRIGRLTNAQYGLFATIQRKSGNGASLQCTITNLSSGVSRAVAAIDGTLGQLESGALVNQASADLLEGLGVALTEAGKRTLMAGSAATVIAETGFAKGRVAEAGGDAAGALFNYAQSLSFDPGRAETLTRLNELTKEINKGDVIGKIIDKVAARKAWLGAFQSAAKFVEEHPPFEITFDPALIQEGEIDYAKETANLAMRISLDPSEAGWGALSALMSGLDNTGLRDEWGFAGLPFMDPTPSAKDAVAFRGKRAFRFKVKVELVNEKKKTIGEGTITLNTGELKTERNMKEVVPPNGMVGLVRFPKVNTNDLTRTLTIVIAEVDGMSARALNRKAYMKIEAGDLEEKLAQHEFRVSGSRERGFVWVEGGTFNMDGNQVTLSKGFYISDHEVTQKEWMEVMGSNPSYWKGDNLPVEQASWYDVIEYCNKRSEREGLTLAYTIDGEKVTWNKNASGYRLPTEAEWEYAARGGNKGKGYEYSGSNSVGDVAWYSGNSGSQTHPVKTKSANELGLYDMSGNVWEWCWDWFGSYVSGSQTDPAGASSRTDRVNRGGSWFFGAAYVRSAYRYSLTPSSRYYALGFRLVRP